jgi:hypothetical protein
LALIVLSVSPALGQSFTDPASYCRVVGTIDKPDARYQGPKLPPWMAAKLHLTSDQGDRMEWRCARGAVLACLYGANIPCDAKADIRRRPTDAIAGFCRENPDSDFVPAVVTGHETVVSWDCQGGRPAVKKVDAVDPQGYAKAFWQRVKP